MRTDLGLRDDVIRALAVEPSLDDARIGVTVHDGVVGLNGTVDSYAKKHAAERAAGRVCGRCVLADGLQVALPDACRSSDAELARRVLAAVRDDPLTAGTVERVWVRDGWVTLAGPVAREYQRRVVARVVRGLTGVRGITARLIVDPRASLARGRIAGVLEAPIPP